MSLLYECGKETRELGVSFRGKEVMLFAHTHGHCFGCCGV